MTADFDHHAESYGREVNDSVSFTGREVDYFAERKAIHLLDLLGRRLGPPSSVRALDVGCGVGTTDAHLAGHLGDLAGIDVSADAVAEAAERNPEVAYRSYAGDLLPYQDATFDLAFAVCVLHHVEPPDRARFTAEMARVVRPGGLVVIFEHNPFNPLTRVAVSRCEFDDGVELLRRSEATRLVSGAGVHPVERRYIMFTPLAGAWSTRIDRLARWVPIGGQYYVAGRRAG